MDTLIYLSVANSTFQTLTGYSLYWYNNYTEAFVETIQGMFLYQDVYEPTRYRPNTTPHVLDLILTNEENMVNDLQYLPGLGLSDHVCLKFSLLL